MYIPWWLIITGAVLLLVNDMVRTHYEILEEIKAEDLKAEQDQWQKEMKDELVKLRNEIQELPQQVDPEWNPDPAARKLRKEIKEIEAARRQARQELQSEPNLWNPRLPK